MHHLHFPITTLTYNGSLIVAAGQKYPAVAARLPASYLTDTAALLAKIPDDVSGQKIKKGETGNLTQAQKASLDTLLHYMNQARKTAKLAFPGQTVKLHQEFQIGAGTQQKNNLGSVLGRADIILASVQTTANLAALKLKGWTDAETTAFTTVRGTFPASTQTQQSGQSDAKKATGVKDADAADLYEHILTIQNAADLEFPAINPANAAERDEFRLNTFPPDNHAPPAPPAPPQPTPPTK
ncbi:MAG TPA: hypothetical protein VFC17_05245 [Candidatus Limnocylindrales bacterium]|nr:hypothetical protein [Candidatus Limnocylindrales bacterium]